jgi:transcriptional regulator with XRE-family HTH domain
MKFNNRLKELMNEKDMTQTDIVKASNLTDSQKRLTVEKPIQL